MTSSANAHLDSLLADLGRIASEVEGSVIFQVSLDGSGNPIDIECLASRVEAKESLPVHLVLERPVSVGARSVVFVSTTGGSVDKPDQREIDFTSRLIEAGTVAGVEVLDHYLVAGKDIKPLRADTPLWESP